MKSTSRVLDYTGFYYTEYMPVRDEEVYGARFIYDKPEKLYGKFKAEKKCPYCKNLTVKVWEVHIDGYSDPDKDDCVKYHECWSCKYCGWWFWSQDTEELMDIRRKARIAILKEFDLSGIQIPVETLRRELNRKPSIIYGIHPKKFEELVASVFKDFYDVQVSIVGRRADGGIDLVFIDSEKPIAVQVKRRESPESTETVTLIREFLGAMVLKGYKGGYIVTTAERFSAGAKKTAEEAKRQRIVNKFELVDSRRFFEIFKFVEKSDCGFPWEVGISDILKYFR